MIYHDKGICQEQRVFIGVFILFWGLSASSALTNHSSQTHATSEETHISASLVFHDIEQSLEVESVRKALINKKIFGVSLITLVCICLFVGAMGKSAQIPLYVWLPDAMAGPTQAIRLTVLAASVFTFAGFGYKMAAVPFHRRGKVYS